MKKEILKETREPGKSRKKKGQPKGRRNGFLKGLTGKDFTAAGLFFFSLLLCRLFVLPKAVLRDRKPLPGFRMESGRRSEYLPFCLLRTAESDRAVILPFPVHPDGPVGDGFLRAAVCGGCSAFLSMDQQKGSALRQLSFYITFLYVFYRTFISFL